MNYQPDKIMEKCENLPLSEGDIEKVKKSWSPINEERKNHNAHQRQLRIDTFACAAMQLIAEKQEGVPVYPFIAKECYDLAEAMEAERTRRMKGLNHEI